MEPRTYHKLLEKQAGKFLSPEQLGQESLQKFLAIISNTYYNFERDKNLSEHAFTISEKEYQELTLRLQQQNDIRTQSILRLKELIRTLDKGLPAHKMLPALSCHPYPTLSLSLAHHAPSPGNMPPPVTIAAPSPANPAPPPANPAPPLARALPSSNPNAYPVFSPPAGPAPGLLASSAFNAFPPVTGSPATPAPGSLPTSRLHTSDPGALSPAPGSLAIPAPGLSSQATVLSPLPPGSSSPGPGLSSLAPDSSPGSPDEQDLVAVIALVEEQIRKAKTLEADLILAKESAEKAFRVKSDFLSVMSHEIRTPLNAIIGISHLLLHDPHYPGQSENLRTLRTSADNLFHLINDILDFGKIEEGRVIFTEKNIDVRRLVTHIRNAHRIDAGEKGNKIKLLFDEELPHSVRGDDTRLSQILNNLLSNAVKFTRNGQITIEILLNRITDQQVILDFSVSDTGIGIDPSKHELIFERFTQANSEITREFGGSGLGLSIIRKLLRLQHSEIHLDSERGKGSRFYFTLAFKKADLLRKEEDPSFDMHNADLGGMKVLLVEDLEFNVLIAEKMLKNWNARVEVSPNGLNAVGKMREGRFDIILMDLQMPVMDGYTATHHIREFNKTVPIIALTASSSSDIQQKAFDCGMTDYLSKPFNPRDLFMTILKYMNNA